jgi:hypothetical protein
LYFKKNVILLKTNFSIMGHGQEIGIIPRFCAELFTRADHEVTRDSEMVSAQLKICLMRILYEKRYSTLGDIVQ